MAQDIVYTLGIVIVIILLILFLRSILIRRQRIVAARAISPRLPQSAWPSPSTHNMDVVRPEAAVRNTTSPAGFFSRAQRSDSRDQLPLYEMPPPGYDVVVKEQEQQDALRQSGELGEPSSAEPPGYTQNGDIVVVIHGGPAAAAVPVPAPAPPPRVAVGDRGRLFKVDVRRAWGRRT